MRAIKVDEVGGPEVLRPAELPARPPGPGEVHVRVAAAGVNFIDVYHRTGLYPLPLAFVPGVEGAGVVAEVGEGASLSVGARVAWAGPAGSYAAGITLPAARVVAVPAGVALNVAAAVMLQGMTAHYLARSTFPIQPGQVALVLAAAGATGQLLTRLVVAAGGRVIGAVGSAAKEAVSLAAGAEAVVRYDAGPIAPAVRAHLDGRGVDVAYDSVGQATFRDSLDALAPRGMLVLYGQASGKVPPFDVGELAARGSLYLTRPSLFHYIATEADLRWRAGEVLAAVARGELPVPIQGEYPLEAAAEAHRVLESRGTTGKLLLIP